ncbi:MAG: hypothetical protein V3T83_20835 [Acidobacteriota bacterium]
MTITIDLSEEQAEALKAQAAAQGLSVEDWLQELARQHTPRSIAHLQRIDPEEWARQFQAWAESHDSSTPVLSGEAMSRDSIYPDRL